VKGKRKEKWLLFYDIEAFDDGNENWIVFQFIILKELG